jgi:hypothetical protein
MGSRLWEAGKWWMTMSTAKGARINVVSRVTS